MNTRINNTDRIGKSFVKEFKEIWPLERILRWAFTVDRSSLKRMLRRFECISEKNGLPFLVDYLKECVLILQHFLAGTPMRLSIRLPVGIVGGLPTIIPGDLRSLIRAGDIKIIRLVFTLFSLYRVMLIPGTLKLESITSPFTGLMETLAPAELQRAFTNLTKGLNYKFSLQKVRVVRSGAVGPNLKSSLLGIWRDTWAWDMHPLKSTLLSFGELLPGGEEFLSMCASSVDVYRDYIDKSLKLHLGRLSLKEEGGGKVRVFAITDVITQTLMAPLHKTIFELLRKIPMDGTFNQTGPLERLIAIKRESPQEIDQFFSFDLSSATDRLPIKVQEACLSAICGSSSFSQLWAKLLTERDWVLPLNASSSNYIKEETSLRYTVGQPMGALSSWAMLAITHHILVQVSSFRVGKPNFTNYALLGDDIVIGDSLVAQAYLAVMRDTLGVEINASKTLVSSDCFEFAKRLVKTTDEFSPLSPKNLLLITRSLGGYPSLLLEAKNKGWVLDEPTVDKMFSKPLPLSGSDPVKTKKVLWAVKGPFGFLPTVDGLTSSSRLANSLSAVRINSLFSSIDDVIHDDRVKRFESNVKEVVDTIVRIQSILPCPVNNQDMEDVLDSDPLRHYLINLFKQDLLDMAKEGRPKRRFFFDGPITFFNFYRQGWMKEVMDYIVKKIKSRDLEGKILPPLDPFKVQMEEPFLSRPTLNPGEKFFSRVKEVERGKDLTRTMVWQ